MRCGAPKGGGLGRSALSATCANKPGLRFLGYIAAPTQNPPPAPLRTPLPLARSFQPSPERARPCVHTVGCAPNDIIVITHYLTSEAALQMILGSRARDAFHYDACSQILGRKAAATQNDSAISDAISCSCTKAEVEVRKNLRRVDRTDGLAAGTPRKSLSLFG